MEHRLSLFGPLLLIAIGIVWALIGAGIIPSTNLWALMHIWPFLLIAAGLGLLLRPYWKYSEVLVNVLVIGGALLAILYAPRLGWATPSFMIPFFDGQVFLGPGEAGSGKVVAETRRSTDFAAIRIDYPAQVEITQGDSDSVRIEAEDNLLPYLRDEVQNGQLRIYYQSGNGKHVNPTKMVKITVVVKDLKDVEFNSAGELAIRNLKSDRLDIALSGAGNLKLDNVLVSDLTVSLSGAGSMIASGTADNLKLVISGFGSFDGAELYGKTADVNLSGAGSATVWVDQQLTAEISGAGSVNYYGSATVTRRISGLGGVNHLGNK